MKFDGKKIAKILTDKGAINKCHRCNSDQFSILEGYSNMVLQDDFKNGVVFGGPAVPVVSIACNNCGSISLHAIGVLGLIPKEEKDKSNE